MRGGELQGRAGPVLPVHEEKGLIGSPGTGEAGGLERRLEEFAPAIIGLPDNLPEDSLRTSRFLLHGEVFGRHEVEVYYAPFDHVNEDAALAVVGITPGRQQMSNAFVEARRCLMQGLPLGEVGSRAKRAASFSGPMRRRLTAWLDGIGIPEYLGVGSAAELFGDSWGMLHATSAVRYPVFVGGENYGGYRPRRPMGLPLFKRYVDEVLADELHRVRGALVVPLGPAVSEVLEHLADHGMIRSEQVLSGFPHPTPGPRAQQNDKLYRDRQEQFREAAGRWLVRA